MTRKARNQTRIKKSKKWNNRNQKDNNKGSKHRKEV